MNEVASNKTKTILRSKSTPNLGNKKKSHRSLNSPTTSFTSTHSSLGSKKNNTSTHSSTTNPKSKTSKTKFGNYLLKFSNYCDSVLHKIRSLSEEVFSTDDLVKEFFVSEFEEDDEFDAFSGLGKVTKVTRGYTSAEEKFIADYDKTKSLEKMFQKNQDNYLPPAVPLKSNQLQEVIRSSSSSSTAVSAAKDSLTYNEINVCEMRKDLESNLDIASNDATLNDNINIGDTLWNYRRSKWLVSSKSEQEIRERIERQLISLLPHEALLKIYNHLINKDKRLKKDKQINLQDLVNVINSGWIAEEKWERAGQGLP